MPPQLENQFLKLQSCFKPINARKPGLARAQQNKGVRSLTPDAFYLSVIQSIKPGDLDESKSLRPHQQPAVLRRRVATPTRPNAMKKAEEGSGTAVTTVSENPFRLFGSAPTVSSITICQAPPANSPLKMSNDPPVAANVPRIKTKLHRHSPKRMNNHYQKLAMQRYSNSTKNMVNELNSYRSTSRRIRT